MSFFKELPASNSIRVSTFPVKPIVTSSLLFCLSLSSFAGTSLPDSAFNLASLRHINAEYLKQSEKILLDVIAQDPQNMRAYWMLARTCDYLGDKAPDATERVRYYESGARNARQAIQLDSNCVWAHYWYTVNLGSIGECKGILNALTMVPEMKEECNRMLRLDPSNALALEVAGMLYAELPAFIGGSIDRAQEYLNRAIACDSNYTASYIDLARILIKKKDSSAAIPLLRKTLAVKNPTDAGENFMYDRPAALKMLQEMGVK